MRLSMLAVAAVSSAVLWMGCGDGGNPGGGGGGGSGGTLSCGNRECKSDVMLDGKTWMTENLNKTTKDSWCYENSADSCAKYGRLYRWDAAKKACPTGWRLPALDEWERLLESVGGTKPEIDGEYSYKWLDVGKKLKSSSGWNKYLGNDGNGTDDYGFSALPGGAGGIVDGKNVFITAGVVGAWWTATDFDFDPDNTTAWTTSMGNYSNTVLVASGRKTGQAESLMSVRCVKN